MPLCSEEISFSILCAAIKSSDFEKLNRLILHPEYNKYVIESNDIDQSLLHLIPSYRLNYNLFPIALLSSYIKPLLEDKTIIDRIDDEHKSPLMYACSERDIDFLQLLLDSGADINVSNDYGEEPFSICGDMQFERGTVLLSSLNLDINSIASDGSNRLHQISNLSEISIVADYIQPLLAIPAEVNRVNDAGETPLMQAVMSNNIDFMNLLIKMGADVNLCRAANDSALTYALFDRFDDGVELLLSKGADIYRVDSFKNSLLHKLIFLPSYEAVLPYIMPLLSDSLQVSKRNCDGETPLMLACEKANTAYVSILLTHGADVNAIDNHGKTALMRCPDDSFLEMFRLLLPYGLSAQAGGTGMTILHRLAQCAEAIYSAPEIASFIEPLLSNKADLDRIGPFGESALTVACERKNIGFMALLLGRGADVSHKDNEGNCLLVTCLRKSFYDGFKLLLSYKADLTVVNVNGNTVLMAAVSARAPLEYIKLIIDEYKGNINVTDNSRQTALMMALRERSLDTVDLLLKAKVTFGYSDNDDNTPMYYVRDEATLAVLVKHCICLDTPMEVREGRTLLMNVVSGRSGIAMSSLMKYRKRLNLDYTDNDGHTALMQICRDKTLAANAGSRRTMKLLLEAGAKANINSCYHSAASYIVDHMIQGKNDDPALTREYEATLALLLEYGADLDIPTEDGLPVLIRAVRAKAMDIVNMLLQKQTVNINAQDNRGLTAIMHASRDPTYAKADLATILAFKPDLNLTDVEGMTAVMGCLDEAEKKPIHADCMLTRARLLLEHGADVNAKGPNTGGFGNNGDTALTKLAFNEYAYTLNKSAWLELLLKHGADLNLFGKREEVPLVLAIKHANCLVPRLIECGASVNVIGTSSSPLLTALTEEASSLVPLLLDNGADVNIVTSGGYSSIMAAMECSPSTLPLLLARGADVNARSNLGRTALMYACVLDKTGYVEQLLDLGADIDAVDDEGNSALMRQCCSHYRHESNAIVDLLLSRGADLNITNKAGKTAADLAYKNKKMYDLLIEYTHKTDFILK